MKYKYWIESGTTMFGIDAQEFAARARSMYSMWSSFCNVTFERSSKKGGSKFRIYGADNAKMTSLVGGAALGAARGNNIWVLTSERKGLNLNRPYTWYVENLTAHESGHVLGLDHNEAIVDRVEPVMNSNATAEFWSRPEVEYWQRRFGMPRGLWVPNDRRIYGARIAEVQAQRVYHKQQRDSHTDYPTRKFHHDAVERLVWQEIQYAQAWFHLKDYWHGTPGVI